jgi:hypothetical protein
MDGEDTEEINKPKQRLSTSLVIREIEIKTMMRYTWISVGMIKSAKLTITSADKDTEQLEVPYISSLVPAYKANCALTIGPMFSLCWYIP